MRKDEFKYCLKKIQGKKRDRKYEMDKSSII